MYDDETCPLPLRRGRETTHSLGYADASVGYVVLTYTRKPYVHLRWLIIRRAHNAVRRVLTTACACVSSGKRVLSRGVSAVTAYLQHSRVRSTCTMVAIAWLRVAADLRSSSFQSRNANRALIPPLPRLVLSVRGKSVATGRDANIR